MELKWIPGPCHSPFLILLGPPAPRSGRAPYSGCLLGAWSSWQLSRRGCEAPGLSCGWSGAGGPCRAQVLGIPAGTRARTGTLSSPESSLARGVFQPGRGDLAGMEVLESPRLLGNPRFHSCLDFPAGDFPLNIRDAIQLEVQLETGFPAVSSCASRRRTFPQSIYLLRAGHPGLRHF